MKEEREDPYEALAWRLVRSCSSMEIKDLLQDPTALANSIYRELIDTDFKGPFLDLIFEELYRTGNPAEVMREMQSLSEVLVNQIDIARLCESLTAIYA